MVDEHKFFYMAEDIAADLGIDRQHAARKLASGIGIEKRIGRKVLYDRAASALTIKNL